MTPRRHLSVDPVLIELQPSRLIAGGIGVFASRTLHKDQVIAEAAKMGERFVPWSAFQKIDATTRRKIKMFCLLTSEGFFAPACFNHLSVPWYMNHSCSHNVGFDEVGNFIATRPIHRGEELLLDYGMLISDPKFRLVCKCGSPHCRKVITGNDWKNPAFVEQNKRYFLRELLQNTGTATCARRCQDGH